MIWYVAYGSNLLWDRFRVYLEGGTYAGLSRVHRGARDPSPPRAQAAVTVPYARYFARYVEPWGGGVAFLDPETPGEVLGRAYLVTGEQFADVHEQEGSWYPLVVDLGDVAGVPVRTFTAAMREPDEPPGEAYLDTIRRGEAETLLLDRLR